jgi:hypothetical protein
VEGRKEEFQTRTVAAGLFGQPRLGKEGWRAGHCLHNLTAEEGSEEMGTHVSVRTNSTMEERERVMCEHVSLVRGVSPLPGRFNTAHASPSAAAKCPRACTTTFCYDEKMSLGEFGSVFSVTSRSEPCRSC